ncbi:MAG: metallopeptidase TldD-related protein [Acidobacteriota bacterium]
MARSDDRPDRHLHHTLDSDHTLPFNDLDHTGIARTLAQIAERPGDLADLYLERREETAFDRFGLRVVREEGVAVRLVRGADVWLTAIDRLDADAFGEAWRRTARAMPRATYPVRPFEIAKWQRPEHDEIFAWSGRLQRALRSRRIRTPPQVSLRRHRAWTRVIGTRLSGGTEHEHFYSIDVELPDARWGGLVTKLDHNAADDVALQLSRATQAHGADPPSPTRACVLGPQVVAVLLHEAVAHALEVDILAYGGHPEAAVGVRLGTDEIDVLDDPSSAPESVRRQADDEGLPVRRRWLLRGGVVEQPLCDSRWAAKSDVLVAGAGRRSGRHRAPAPRSSHLELRPGEHTTDALLAATEGGLYLTAASRGRLDPLSGHFILELPYGRRITNGMPAEPVGPSVLRGHVSDLLRAVTAVGAETAVAGAGWCAKDGMRLPVWATVSPMRLEGVEIGS